MNYIRWFRELDRNSLPIAGGKGANLGEMTSAGLSVPEGYVVATTAYREFVLANGLQPQIERLAALADPDDTESLDQASAQIRALFGQGVIPASMATAITEAYGSLGAGAVAVRSSATAEDLPSASFAGQQESYLHIEGAEAVLTAVRRCWSSLWTARALSYRVKQQIAPAEVTLAVVVQSLIPAQAAGVLFTANPLNGRRDQMVIDGSWGLGEAVVSGQVTPDHWVVVAASGESIESSISRKLVWTVGHAGRTETMPIPSELQEQPCLDADQIKALVAMGRQVADHYGCPQDIEWAFSGDGRLFLLQTRPVTSLFPDLCPPVPTDKGLRLYICFNTLQGLAEPLTPAGVSAFQMAGCAAGTLLGMGVVPGEIPPAMKSAAGRLYLDATNLVTHRRTKSVILFLMNQIDHQTSSILRGFVEHDPRVAERPGLPFRAPRAMLLALVRRLIATMFRPDQTRDLVINEMNALVAEWERQAEQLSGVEQRVEFIRRLLGALLPQFVIRIMPVVAVAMISRFNAERKLAQWLGDCSDFQTVLRSLPHNPTTQMDLALWRLSRALKAEGATPTPEHPLVQAFLAEYGHRAVREIDIGMPRWWDDPEHVITVLQTYLSHDESSDAEQHFRRGEQEAEQAVARLVSEIRRRKGPMAAGLIAKLLYRTRALMGVREYPKFYAVRLLALVRRVLGGIGDELAQSGRLRDRDDIHFLSLYDLGKDTDLASLAAANRVAYAREMERRAVPRVITSEGETFYTANTARAGALVGTPASVGMYEGRVRVIRDPKGAKLAQGEILVAPGTDPAWTPLFLSAGALVMEIGGAMSHGSVVAREYGIPAVVGVVGATEQLHTGQLIRVDGGAGTIEILSEDRAEASRD